jgi:hypothetical protein
VKEQAAGKGLTAKQASHRPGVARALGLRAQPKPFALGGGVYNLGTFLYDALTVIDHNHASTSNDDCFGC